MVLVRVLGGHGSLEGIGHGVLHDLLAQRTQLLSELIEKDGVVPPDLRRFTQDGSLLAEGELEHGRAEPFANTPCTRELDAGGEVGFALLKLGDSESADAGEVP